MFTNKVFVTRDSHKSAKNFLARFLPNQNASHRAEGLARLLGFNSNAAFLAALTASPLLEVDFRASEFFRFFDYRPDLDGVLPHLLFSHLAILDVLRKQPKISIWGYGFGRPLRVGNRFENPEESYRRFQKDRDELTSRLASEGFLRCLHLLRHISATKTVRRGCGSYMLKHVAENMTVTLSNGCKLEKDYVANGTLVVAAVYLGFKFKSYLDDKGYDFINVDFNMSKHDVERINLMVRPTSGRAQDYAFAKRLKPSFAEPPQFR